MKKEAIKWLLTLRDGKYKKTTGRLSKRVDKIGREVSEGGTLKHCCLGVGCRINGIDYDPKLAFEPRFETLVGIKYRHRIYEINDELFAHDKNFKNVFKAIVRDAKNIFNPGVAQHVQKTFKDEMVA